MKTNIHFRSYPAQFFLEWKIFQTKVVEKLEQHTFDLQELFFENRAVYEIMWENGKDMWSNTTMPIKTF